jgi:DNA-binding MarR family transcriptional regulator
MSDISGQKLWQKLAGLRRHLQAGIESSLTSLSAMDLTVPQAMALFRVIERGPQTIGQLQTAVGRSQAATSHLVATLEKKKLVARKNDAADARRTLVHPTARAIELVREVEGLRALGLEKAMARVPAPVVRRFDEALTAVLAALEDT